MPTGAVTVGVARPRCRVALGVVATGTAIVRRVRIGLDTLPEMCSFASKTRQGAVLHPPLCASQQLEEPWSNASLSSCRRSSALS